MGSSKECILLTWAGRLERERERWVWRKGEDSREGGGGLMGLAGGNISDGHGDAFGIK